MFETVRLPLDIDEPLLVALMAAAASLTLVPVYGLAGAGMTMVLIFGAQLIVISVGLLFNLPTRSDTSE